MHPRRPVHSGLDLRIKHLLLWSTLLVPSLVAALQQQPISHESLHHSVNEQGPARAQVQESVYTPHANPHGFRDTYAFDEKVLNNERQRKQVNDNRKARTSTNERALATVPTSGANPAVPAPPAKRSAASSAGLTSRQSARSLQEFEVEDIILLATVDGKLHARDRKTGVYRWHLESDKPMVETIYHRHNKSVDENGLESEDPLWIVEPSQDGSIYVYAPGSGFGMHRLGFTVKQLAEMAPYASEGQPAVAYTAEKKNTLYTVDAATGNILKSFSAGGVTTNNDRSCRRVNPLEAGLEDEECESIGTLTLGRTDYTIGIQDRRTGERISTLRYFEWGPNKWDQGLVDKYTNTMDDKYVYSRHDGMVYGVDILRRDGDRSRVAKKASFYQKFDTPVVRVYDVVRPLDDWSTDTSLVVLPQPTGPSLDELSQLEVIEHESVFVNCTESGGWYALSESNYPTVTQGAMQAKCQTEDLFALSKLPMTPWQRERFAGVHLLSSVDSRLDRSNLIDAPPPSSIDTPNDSRDDRRGRDKDILKPVVPLHQQQTPTSTKALFLLAILGLITWLSFWQGRLQLPNIPQVFKNAMQSPMPTKSGMQPIDTMPAFDERQSKDSVLNPPTTPKIREHEPAQEFIFPHKDSPAKQLGVPDAQGDDDDFEIVEADDQEAVGSAIERTNSNANDDTPKPKKRATRGKRGGVKNRQKQEEKAQKWVEKQKAGPTPVEVITVAASESPQMTGPLEINSLIINTDKVIGQGSCGTMVFEGSFEGRNVAVKRMLSQYYELASQEVSFLQQSDDHPNVVRYFCQQKDSHFLYIAVELCQASLAEVWEAEKSRSPARQQQLQLLKLAIQQNVHRTLQQLAAGLYHLHNLRIIHRDIKPQNILVAYPKKAQSNTGPRLVISDFGLGKNLPENVSTLIDPTGNAGTSGWKAPELISQPARSEPSHSHQGTEGSHTNLSEANGAATSGLKRAADIFSMGCLFFWVLTNGTHPYEDDNGWTQLRELNIKRDNKKMGVLEQWSDAYEPMQLITSMLEHQPEERPTALQVLHHPFFWPPEKRLSFLCDCSDHFEREPRGTWEDAYADDSDHLRLLESRAEEIIGPSPDFLAKLDRHFVDTLGKQRKYSGSRVLDLLRALRNKKNHYEDMPEEVKKRVGGLPGGYLAFWCNRFPRLLMACYQVIHECGIENNDRFKGYFTISQA